MVERSKKVSLNVIAEGKPPTSYGYDKKRDIRKRYPLNIQHETTRINDSDDGVNTHEGNLLDEVEERKETLIYAKKYRKNLLRYPR